MPISFLRNFPNYDNRPVTFPCVAHTLLYPNSAVLSIWSVSTSIVLVLMPNLFLCPPNSTACDDGVRVPPSDLLSISHNMPTFRSRFSCVRPPSAYDLGIIDLLLLMYLSYRGVANVTFSLTLPNIPTASDTMGHRSP